MVLQCYIVIYHDVKKSLYAMLGFKLKPFETAFVSFIVSYDLIKVFAKFKSVFRVLSNGVQVMLSFLEALKKLFLRSFLRSFQ